VLGTAPLLAFGTARGETTSACAAELGQAPEALLRLAARLRRLAEDGLDPRLYAIPADAAIAGSSAVARADLLQAAGAALTDLLHGRVQEPASRPDIRRRPEAIPLAPWLAELAGAAEPAAVIDRAALLPPDAAALKRALAAARERVATARAQPPVPGFEGVEALEPGASDPLRVPALRARFPDAPSGEDPTLYDPALVEAVKRLQAAHGLEPDGRIGRATIAALNGTAQPTMIRSLRAALDMRRAAAPPPAGRRIEVNIPHQRLQVLDGNRVLLEMAVIVGKPARATPPLRTALTAVQLNPPWGVPVRNAREDLLPKFRANPRAMVEKGFRVFSTVEGQLVEVPVLSIDWRMVSAERFPYVIRQEAGEANALGRLKFIIPNGDDIFLHDTPDRGLFRRAERALSSGCIRLERPMELLALVLEGTAGWDRARAQRVLDSGKTTHVPVARSLPVRLHYSTAVVEGPEPRLRADIYALDEAYLRALDAPRAPRIAALTGDR